jgi:hypothetical protein
VSDVRRIATVLTAYLVENFRKSQT